MNSMKGKIAVITGAASGIGLATVKSFVAVECSGVCLVDLKQESLDKAISTFSAIEQSILLGVAADVSNEADVERYIEKTIARFGRLDCSVQCAGITHEQCRIQDLDAAVLDKVYAVNVRGPFLGMKHSIKAMLAAQPACKGSIVLVGSQLGLDGAPMMAAYASSKFAVRGLAATAAAELGSQGIRVNVVAPGPIETPMLLELPREHWPTFAAKAMLERLGKPEEIAQAILFLASDASSYVTGSTLKVDGGFSRFL